MKVKAFFGIMATLTLSAIIYIVAAQLNCDGPHPALYCPALDSFGNFYSEKLRASLFAGFLTLGGFLMSLKTFIIVNMKKEVYDTKYYQDIWYEQKKIDKNNLMPSIYHPLRQLSNVLYITILLCVSSAVSQLTVGLFGNLWTSIFCVWMSSLSIASLIWSLILIRKNLTNMFNNLDKQQQLKDSSQTNTVS